MGVREVLLGPVSHKLEELDLEFQRQLESPIPIIAEINAYIARHSGKRIRPALLLLCARLLDYRGRGDVVFAAVIEFIHTATLIHDDIIDNASVRRGHRSVNAIWGNNLTVLLGDYLYLKSMELALTERSLDALRVLTQVTIEMIEGELIQDANQGKLEVTREDYLEIIRRKTAALFSGCGRIAALLAGADPERSEALARYCTNLGMAFQLVDDMLDFVGTETELGKPVINDLREGRVTLPVIELLERARPEALEPIRAILATGEAGAAEQAEVLRLLHEHGTLESTTSLAHVYAKEARKHLAPFPDSPARRALEAIPDYLLSRSA